MSVANDGSITARGYYATGIHAQSGGDVSITNYANGTIDAGSTSSSALAWGIYAASNGEGSQVTVDNAASIRAAAVYGATGISAVASGLGGTAQVNNSGDITALGYFGANGISAVASGLGGTASVDNSGNITVAQGNKYGYGANGIFVSADGDATITNTGAITVNSYGAATGLAALSFAGNASVVNAGDIMVDSQAVGYYSAYGIVAFSANGAASADSSGNIGLSTKYIGAAMDVSGLEGATATNSGDISVDAWRAYGIRAQSGNGDVAVDNSGSIYATYTGGYYITWAPRSASWPPAPTVASPSTTAAASPPTSPASRSGCSGCPVTVTWRWITAAALMRRVSIAQRPESSRVPTRGWRLLPIAAP